MKLVITRVDHAAVNIDGACHASIGKGFLVLCGVAEGDGEADVAYLAKKTAGLRVFSDDEGKMNRSCADVGGEILVVSNFTLLAETRKGNRPSFVRAAAPELANALYESYVETLRKEYGYTVKTGVFAAHMELSSQNNGPITILMDSKEAVQ
ncbi:MAG: D-tyrosyl-tRNA(Tyr) deacylase [Oscillospiraceae bacterium]|nr:D-tyrosyl-tRNA(Tyr) deacylase [Oscillospiraceae bacterium]